jgi:hypothetical protein
MLMSMKRANTPAKAALIQISIGPNVSSISLAARSTALASDCAGR